GPCDEPECNECNSTGSPVYIPTGHFVWTDRDVELRGRPRLVVARTFNSNDPRLGPFGNGWSVPWDVALYATTSGDQLKLIYRDADGKRYEYLVQSDGSVVSPAGHFERVLPQTDGTVQ